MYLPSIHDATRVNSYLIGPYIAVLLTDCESSGEIDYEHVLYVYLPDPEDGSRPQVILAVAAESSAMMRQFSKGDDEPFVLGVFPGDGHHNLGASPDWGDLDKFRDRAFEIVQERLNIDKPPFRIPDDAGRRPHTDD